MTGKRAATTNETIGAAVSSQKTAIACVENGSYLMVHLVREDHATEATVHMAKQGQLIEHISVQGAEWGDAIALQIQSTCAAPRNLCLLEESSELISIQIAPELSFCSSCSLEQTVAKQEIAASAAYSDPIGAQDGTIFIYPVTHEHGIATVELSKLLESHEQALPLTHTVILQLQLLKHIHLEETLLLQADTPFIKGAPTQVEKMALSQLQEQWGVKSAEDSALAPENSQSKQMTTQQLQQLISLLYKQEESR